MHFYIFLLILLFNQDVFALGLHNNSAFSKRSPRRHSIVSLIFSNNTAIKNISTNRTSCRWLRGYKHQNKLCRNRKGISEALLEARNLAVHDCEEQFRYDRWNCSYKKQIFKRIFRETAFVHAISSSAIMYSVAKACSRGQLQNCRCAQQENFVINQKDSWKWGGCGDNTKQAKKITSKFLQLRQKGDTPHTILNYNSLIGLKVVVESERKACQCHGVSGSCVMRTCWKSLHQFAKISEKLKKSYHSAIKHSSKNTNEQTVKKTMTEATYRLLYLAESPSFCQSTVGRRCKDTENCATLCCGRGYEQKEIPVVKFCHCRWQHSSFVDLKCDTCRDSEETFICK